MNYNKFFQLSIYIFFIGFSSCSSQDYSALPSKSSQRETSETNGNSNQIAQNIVTIFEDSKNNLWFGTSDQGAAKYDGKQLTYLNKEGGMCGSTVANMIEDDEGNLWFGTYSDLCVLNYKNNIASDVKITTFQQGEDGKPFLGYGWKSIRRFTNGEIWLITHRGIYKLENGNFNEFETPVKNPQNGSLCSTPGKISLDFIDSQGNYWFGTDGEGVYKYDGLNFKQFTKKHGLSSNTVVGITEDKKGNMWFACRKNLDSDAQIDGGISRYDGTQFINFPDKVGLHNNDINTIYADQDQNIWIGATGTGIYKVNGEMFTLYNEPTDINNNTFYVNGLQSVLHDSQNRLWFGFNGGLYRLENNKLVNVKTDGPWKS